MNLIPASNIRKIEVFMEMAVVLSQLSTCSRRKVGAILVDANHHIIGSGYNGVPKKLPHCTDIQCGGENFPSGQGLDVCQAIHAEQNALMQCPDVMKIDRIYVTTFPCTHCIKMLLNTGCKSIYYREPYSTVSEHIWKSASVPGERTLNVYHIPNTMVSKV